MTAFLFVTASVAVVMGLVGLVVGPLLGLWRIAQKKSPPLRGRQAGAT
jgi:hypothetical protein